jgi:hypothetical protein
LIGRDLKALALEATTNKKNGKKQDSAVAEFQENGFNICA